MWRRPVIYAIGLLTPALFVVELTVFAGTRLVHTGGDSDPFAPYEAIMPGQPTTALEQYPCQFERASELDTDATVCRIRPGEGIFSQVIVLFHGDRIWQVVFKMEGLRVGDLVQRWGYPDFNENQRGFLSLRGHGEMDAIIALRNPLRRFHYLFPLDWIVVETIEE
jgi:hypothetical protein